MRGSGTRTFILSSLIFLMVLASSVLFINSLPESPEKEVAIARKALAEAGMNQSNIYAAGLHSEAQGLYDSAINRWKLENQRWIFTRDYETVTKLARESAASSIKAMNAARMDAGILSATLKHLADSLNDVIRENTDLIGRLPLETDVIHRFNTGRLLLAEALISIENKQLISGMDKLQQARTDILYSTDHLTELLHTYFRDLPHWKKWTEKTIQESARKKTTAIVIDKFGARCYVYKNGQLVHSFPAEFGKSWIGHKRIQGDLATPEGIYRVTDRKQGAQTRFYKALLLDYPNREDRKRFEESKSRGEIPMDAKIGGLIEIHGHGGKGVNWTEGCIALENADMDKLFPLVVPGTPVTIVGSMKEAETFLHEKDE